MTYSPRTTEIAMLSTHDVECPYCGEPIDLVVDSSGGEQRYIEDCQVCCRPMLVRVAMDDEGFPSVDVEAESG